MSQVTTKWIANNAVTNAKAAQMPANTIKGNNTGSTANASDLTVSQAQTLLGIPTSGSPLAVNAGGTGSSTLTLHNVILGNGTSPVQFVAPGTSGNVLTSNGTTWTSATPTTGANQHLSNLLSPTAINQDLIFDKASTATVKTDDASVATQDLTLASGSAVVTGTSGNLNLQTGDSTDTGSKTGDINLNTGSPASADTNSGAIVGSTAAVSGTGNSGLNQFSTGGAVDGTSGGFSVFTGTVSGTGTSGDIALNIGTSTGTRGHIKFVDGTEGTAGQVWTSINTVGAGAWAPASTGTVTSVAFTDGSTTPIFTVTGSPITTSGTITNTLATQTANKVFAGPTSGGAAQPTFRSLVSADIPSLSSIYLPLAGGTMSGNINMGSNSITSLASPVNPNDAVNKAYVDNFINATSWKTAALVATTANITLSGEQTIDGFTTSSSRVLVKNQTTQADNGIYTSSSGSWTRTSDMNTWAQVPAAAIFIEEGTVNADIGFVCTSQPGGTLGTTAITFVQFSSAGAYSADNVTLQLISGVFSIKNGGVTETQINNSALSASGALSGGSGTKLSVNVDNSTIDISSNNLEVKNAGITLAKLASNSVDENKIVSTTFSSTGGLTGGSGTKVSANVDSATIKINGSNQLEALTPVSYAYTLTSTDITNQYIDLTTGNGFPSSNPAFGTTALKNSVSLVPVNGPLQDKGVDFTVSLTGGSGGSTRLTFAGDLATGGNAALVAGDIVTVLYSYL